MYPSDLTDVQWAVLEPVLLAALAEERRGRHAGGRPRKYTVRRVLDAILYVARTGCQWRQLPVNFPPWLSCHQQFRAWRDSGLWERINAELVRQSRLRQGREATPTAAIIDSQSAKTALKGGSAGMTRASGSRAASATLRSTATATS
jgi:putative transposase